MGKYFKDTEELYRVISALFNRVRFDHNIGGRLRESGLIIQFRYTDPEGVVTVNFRDHPDEAGAYGTFGFGETDLEPDVTMTQSADFSHLFWYGRANVMSAIATRKVVAKGSVPKALKLLPAIHPVFTLYPRVLKELGMEHLLLPEKKKKGRRRGVLSPRNLFSGRRRWKEFDLAPFRGAQIPLYEEEPMQDLSFKEVALPQEERALKEEMLRRMLLIRYFEELLSREFASGNIPTQAIHLSIGQEAVAVGVCFALESSDTITTTHRGHGHMIAKGADPSAMFAEIFGRSTGLCKGKGGSMHVTDASIGALGANGIVGASPLIAVGAGLSSFMRRSGQVNVAFLGDGATNQGMFHEAANLAAVWDLPVVFAVEHNLYGEFTHISKHCKLESLSERSMAYGIKGVTVDGNDVWQVYQAAREAVARARRGEGPTILECLTYRWHGHMEGETIPYRSEEEIASWKERCPIKRWKERMFEEGYFDEEMISRQEREVEEEVNRAYRLAIESPEPEPPEAMEGVFSPDPVECYREEEIHATREVTFSEAVNMALAEEMRRDRRIFLIGEDVSTGGYFAVTNGLVEEFGEERVRDTPISEYGILGGSIGAAMMGMRPVAEILFSDFLTACIDPIVNQAAKLRYMSGGQYQIPVVIRTPGGAGLGMAAQHSQSLEALLLGVPGLIILAPSSPMDAKGMLKSAIRSNNPVLFFEHKLLYLSQGKIPEGDYLVPIGKCSVRRPGRDVTVVALLYMVQEALEAADVLSQEGIDVEVIDPRTMVPIDLEGILRSIQKTGRLVIIEEGPMRAGFGAELAASVSQVAFRSLKSPIIRIGALDAPIPYNLRLERTVIPDKERIIEAIRKLFL